MNEAAAVLGGSAAHGCPKKPSGLVDRMPYSCSRLPATFPMGVKRINGTSAKCSPHALAQDWPGCESSQQRSSSCSSVGQSEWKELVCCIYHDIVFSQHLTYKLSFFRGLKRANTHSLRGTTSGASRDPSSAAYSPSRGSPHTHPTPHPPASPVVPTAYP